MKDPSSASAGSTNRSLERLRAHWEVERELADRLRHASREERTRLYGEVYNELFRRVPDHPQLVWRQTAAARQRTTAAALGLVRRFLNEGGSFLEIGAGDCALSLAVSRLAHHVIAVDVSSEIAAVEDPPPNFELLITDGRQIPVEPGSVDLAYSNQLMEHLHPEDAEEQLRHIFAALRPGGHYVCLTPNRVLGPADISQYFVEDVAEGFHLREYSTGELTRLMTSVGFERVRVIATLRGKISALPPAPFMTLESGLEALPKRLRSSAKHLRLVRKAISPGGGVVAIKR